MASASPASAGWSGRLVAALVEGRADASVGAHLNRLLRWLIAPDGPEAEPIRCELRRRAIEPGWARRMALLWLEELLFARPDAEPARVLGMGSRATKEEIHTRYRLLMRVYHPDLAEGDPSWLTERAERINRAYARLRREGARRPARRAAPPVPAPARRLRRRAPTLQQRLRRWLGGPRAARRRFLAGVVLIGAGLVIHTCVSQRAWLRWPAAAQAAPEAGAAARGSAPR